ncbi:MAG: hypothetical protein Q4E51_08550 [Lachnospiraceae bacterium]|nr:hypothetical protein [Lachnospiraceae bacterium]
MNKRKKNFSSGVNVGSSSILVTFVLLCLVTFAALSFVSANSDYRLSRQSADRMGRYYEANRMAEVYLLNIESQIKQSVDNCSSEKEFLDGLDTVFADNNSIEAINLDGKIVLNYSVAITDKQNLEVTLETNYADAKDDLPFTITKWQAVSSFAEEDLDTENNAGLLF